MSGLFLLIWALLGTVATAALWAVLIEAQHRASRDDETIRALKIALRDASDAAAADRAEVERLGLLLIEHGVSPDLLAAQDQALALVAPAADVVPMRGVE